VVRQVIIQPVWHRHEEVSDGREQSSDADEAWFVTATSEVTDEHDDAHVHDVAARRHDTRLCKICNLNYNRTGIA